MLKNKRGGTLLNFNGKLLKIYNLPKLEFESQGNIFPVYRDSPSNGRFTFKSRLQNTIYIDVGDGSPVYSYDFIGEFSLSSSNFNHTYSDNKPNHKIEMWFKKPNQIYYIFLYRTDLRGAFPKGISLYNLEEFICSGLKFSNFPVDTGAIKVNRLSFSDITDSTSIDYLPEWIYASLIENINIGIGFVFKDNTVFDRLNEINNLEAVSFSNGNNLTNVTSNFKNYTNIKYLCIGGSNKITHITKEINDCKHLISLAFGYSSVGISLKASSSAGSNNFTYWGEGLRGMINLETIAFGNCFNMTTDEITGLEDCISLKDIYCRGTYDTPIRMEEFTTNLYNQINRVASKTTNNTLLRSIELQNCYVVSTDTNKVSPTGVYQQPQGFIKGVSNGEPISSRERYWVLVNQYAWVVRLTTPDLNNIEILAP